MTLIAAAPGGRRGYRWRMTWYLRTLGFATRASLSAVRVVARFARTANPRLAAARRDVEEPLVSAM